MRRIFLLSALLPLLLTSTIFFWIFGALMTVFNNYRLKLKIRQMPKWSAAAAVRSEGGPFGGWG